MIPYIYATKNGELSRVLLGGFFLGALEFVGLRFKTSPKAC